MKEEDKLQSKLTQIIISSSDPEELKNKIVKEVAISLDAYRCAFIEYDSSRNQFKKIINSYNRKRDARSLLGFDTEKNTPALAMKQKYMKSIVIKDTGEYIEKKRLASSNEDVFFKDYNVKSLIGLRLEFGENFLGVFVVHYDKTNPPELDSHLKFLKDIVEHISIALYLSTLYVKERLALSREKLLRDIVETIRNTLDINEIKKAFVTRIGQFYDVDRAFFVKYDSKTDTYLPVDEYSEYLPASDIGSFVGFRFDSSDWLEFIDLLKDLKEINFSVFDDYIREHNLENTGVERIFRHCKIKSGFNFLITYGEDILGFLCIDFIKKKYEIKDEDYNFLRALVNQFAIALHQSELYENEKHALEREKLARDITETISTTLDIKKAKQMIVEELGKAFNADRCYIRSFNKKKNEFMPPEVEYLRSPEIKSLLDEPVNQEGLKFFIEEAEREKEYTPFIVNQELLDKKHFRGSLLEDYLNQNEIKTDIAIPMGREDELFFLILHFKDNISYVPEEDLMLMDTLAKQIIVAIDKANLFENIRKKAEREKFLREIVEKIRSTLNTDQLKTFLVTSIGEFFNADRVLFSEYNPKKNMFSPVPPCAEYLSSSKEKSFVGYDWSNPEIREYIEPLLNKEELNIYNLDEYLEENPKSQGFIDLFKDAGVQSGYNISVLYKNRIMGYFCIEFTQREYRFTEDELNFVRSICDQTSIALYQVELYEKQKRALKSERLLRMITSKIRSTLDIEELIPMICDDVAKTYNVQRATIVEYPEFAEYKEWIVRHEYKSRSGIMGLTDACYDPRSRAYIGREVVGERKIFAINNISESDTPDYFKMCYETLGVKSVLSTSIQKGDKKWGFIFLSEYDYYREWSDEEIELLNAISDQIYIALQQAELYEKERQSAKRERLLRETTSFISSTLDINKIKNTLVTGTGKLLTKASRSFIIDYVPEKKYFLTPDENSESLRSKKIRSLQEYGENFADLRFWSDRINNKQEIMEPDTEKFVREYHMENTPEGNVIREYDIKGIIVLPVVYADELLAAYGIHYDEANAFDEDDVNLIRVLASQTAIAMYQSRQYEKIKQTAEREKLLRDIIETIRSTLDINVVKKNLVTEIGKALNADRVFLDEFDPETTTPQVLDEHSEYLSSPNLYSLVGYDFASPDVEFFTKTHAEQKPVIVQDVDKYIRENNLQGTTAEVWLKKIGVKAGVAISIAYSEKVYGVLAIHYIKAKAPKFEELTEFFTTLGNQAGIVLYQTKLFEEIKQTAERESLLRQTVQAIRSSLDINQVLADVCDEIAKTYGVERASIIEIPNPENYKEWIVRREYKVREDIKGLFDVDFAKETGEYNAKTILKEGRNLVIDNLYESDTPDFFKKDYDAMGVKSILSVPIRKDEDKWGVIFLSEYDDFRHWTEDEIKLLESISDQIFIAIKQAELYEKVKQTAEKERILREFVSEASLLQSVDDVYNYVIKKMADYLNVERVAFTEIPYREEVEPPIVKYEYTRKEGMISALDIEVPWNLYLLVFEKINNFEPYIIYDVDNTPELNDEDKEYFRNLNISADVILPVLRYGVEKQNLGMIALAQSEPRQWTEFELSVLTEMAEAGSKIIWEVIKLAEIEELRTSFMMTLAHDLQVPIIGEKKALEYLLKRPDDNLIGKYKPFIETMAKEGEDVIFSLKRLIDIYSYELGKKQLDLKMQNYPSVINEIIDSFSGMIKEKSIIFSIEIEADLPEIKFDRNEIETVLSEILKNAIMYIQDEGKIEVRVKQSDNFIITEIYDNGPGIIEEVRKKIFQKFAMIETIERKVGSGLGLYLCKQIIEAHKGKIWYKTEVNKGTTFSFTIPV